METDRRHRSRDRARPSKVTWPTAFQSTAQSERDVQWMKRAPVEFLVRFRGGQDDELVVGSAGEFVPVERRSVVRFPRDGRFRLRLHRLNVQNGRLARLHRQRRLRLVAEWAHIWHKNKEQNESRYDREHSNELSLCKFPT